MSRGVLDEAAHEAAKRACEAAAKRGERVIAMRAYGEGESRRFHFTYARISRGRRAAEPEPPIPFSAPAPPLKIARGAEWLKPVQGQLL